MLNIWIGMGNKRNELENAVITFYIKLTLLFKTFKVSAQSWFQNFK